MTSENWSAGFARNFPVPKHETMKRTRLFIASYFFVVEYSYGGVV